MTFLQSRFCQTFGSLYCYFLFFCSIYLHLTLCFRKYTQVSIPDIRDLKSWSNACVADEKQKNFVEPIKGMTFCLALSCSVPRVEAFAAWGSLICELESIISWPLLNHKSSLPLPSSFLLKRKKEKPFILQNVFSFYFPLLHVAGMDSVGGSENICMVIGKKTIELMPRKMIGVIRLERMSWGIEYTAAFVLSCLLVRS